MGKKSKRPALPKVDDGWKRLKDFAGIKFNDHEKERMWPAVKGLYFWTDSKGALIERGGRPDLGTWIKEAIFQRVDREQAEREKEALELDLTKNKQAARAPKARKNKRPHVKARRKGKRG